MEVGTQIVRWTDEMKAKLKELRKYDMPFSSCALEISREFGVEVSKSSCVGMANRLGMKADRSRTSQRNATFHKAGIKKAEARRVPKLKIVCEHGEPPAIGPINDFPPQGCCLWIHGDVLKEDWQACGNEVNGESSYCTYHFLRTIVKIKSTEAERELRRRASQHFMRRVFG